MKKKKMLSLTVLAVAVAMMMVTGCSKKDTAQNDGKNSAYPTNEVLSLEPYDAGKTTILFSTTDNVDADALKEALQEEFPQYNLLFQFRKDTDLKIENDSADFYLFGDLSLSKESEERLMDLSTLNSTSRYYATTLQRCTSAYDGKLYMLPTPASVMGIVYNKTMFEENNWSVPHSRTEFVELCHTIQDSGVVERAFAPTLKFSVMIDRLGQLFNESDYFDTVTFTEWQKNYAESDDETSRPLLQNLYDTYKYYMDEGVMQVGDFTLKPPERSQMMYSNRTAAMTVESNKASKYAKDAGSSDEFGMFPFYSGDEPDDAYVSFDTTIFLCVSKKVEADEAKLKAVTEILDYIATEEGQNAFSADDNLIPLVKNVEVDYTQSPILEGVADTIDAGRMVNTVSYFLKSPVYSRKAIDCVMNGLFHSERMGTEIIQEDRAVTMDEAVSYMDGINNSVKTMTDNEVVIVYAVAKTNFTQLETAEYMASMFQNWAETDIGLCLSNATTRGPMDAFSEGKLAKVATPAGETDIVTKIDWTERGIAIDEDDQKLVVLSMTGQQIRQALEYPAKGNGISFFTASGLKIEYAPWAEEGSRYLKVTLADGSELEADKLYTVAAWNYTVDEQYITEKVKVYDDKFQDMLRTQLINDKEIAPFDDGRFVLNWDVRSES